MAVSRLQLRLIMVIGAVVFVGVLVHSTMQQNQNEYEVCMTFKGALHCATAKGETPDAAIRAARDIDCEMLANGRDQNMVCQDMQPASVKQVK
ncbi:MAG: hypothetical protein WA823_15070 [Candidatus Acidiferrales bacterium]